jgi:tetratricopeptide (TPR) repeat protein
LSAADQVELAIVASGARRDLGQHDAALQVLRDLVRASPPQRSWSARLYYAYAEALLGVDDYVRARAWFARALDADQDNQTDAADRLAELDGVDIVDMGADDDADGTDDDPTEADEEPGR